MVPEFWYKVNRFVIVLLAQQIDSANKIVHGWLHDSWAHWFCKARRAWKSGGQMGEIKGDERSKYASWWFEICVVHILWIYCMLLNCGTMKGRFEIKSDLCVFELLFRFGIEFSKAASPQSNFLLASFSPNSFPFNDIWQLWQRANILCIPHFWPSSALVPTNYNISIHLILFFSFLPEISRALACSTLRFRRTQ